MGRYAYFSTGFTQKFCFGVQESSDIREFGGQNRNRHWGDAMIQWNATLDRDQALDVVIDKLNCKKEDLAWIDELPKTIEGTQSIECPKHENREIQALAYLGILIQHQLAYDPHLHCTYEDYDYE